MPSLVSKTYYERLEITDEADADAVKKVPTESPPHSCRSLP
jgi:hypothetical protein